jgi:hypothetical protein
MRTARPREPHDAVQRSPVTDHSPLPKQALLNVSRRASMLPDDMCLMTMSRGAPDAMACTGYDWDIPTPRLDDRRRVACKGADELDYRFRCGMLRMSLSEAAVLREDCSMVFPLNTSNWLAATAEPRCALEQLARGIFEEHTRGVKYDKAISGAEVRSYAGLIYA